MHIFELSERSPQRIAQLIPVWEASVRATHHFLSPQECEAIKGYLPQALRQVAHLLVAEREEQRPLGFMGVEGPRLEMLFLLPSERGRGLGRQLLQHAIDRYAVRELTVNEQNPQAVGFYEHVGFQTYRRTALDEQGNPYPLLYMRLP